MFKKITASILLALMLFNPLIGFADNIDFDYTFTNDKDTVTLASGKKSDDEQYWYLTITSGPSSTNVFGGRVWVGGERGSTYRIWKSTISKQKYDYYPEAGAKANSSVSFNGKKDNSSTSKSDLHVVGVFCP